MNSICSGCENRGDFDFFGCALNCERFREHLKKVVESKRNPCCHIDCGVPITNGGSTCWLRDKCPILDIYVNGEEGYSCYLGKDELAKINVPMITD